MAVDHFRSFSLALFRLCTTGKAVSYALLCASSLCNGFVVVAVVLFLYFEARPIPLTLTARKKKDLRCGLCVSGTTKIYSWQFWIVTAGRLIDVHLQSSELVSHGYSSCLFLYRSSECSGAAIKAVIGGPGVFVCFLGWRSCIAFILQRWLEDFKPDAVAGRY